jgi:hypothetical protein
MVRTKALEPTTQTTASTTYAQYGFANESSRMMIGREMCVGLRLVVVAVFICK